MFKFADNMKGNNTNGFKILNLEWTDGYKSTYAGPPTAQLGRVQDLPSDPD